MTAFRRVVSAFFVSDMARALDFWTETLGFVVAFTNGDPVNFAIVNRDDVDMHIGLKLEAAGHGHCHIVVDGGLDALYNHCVAAGVTVKQKPKTQSWGLRDIVICDPDGNTIEIAERESESENS